MGKSTRRKRRTIRPLRHNTCCNAFEQLEARVLLAAWYRSVGGSGTELGSATWGPIGQVRLRIGPVGYSDAMAASAGGSRPSARELSNLVLQQHLAEDIFNEEGVSAFAYAWRQFIDHDMDL